MGMVVLKRAEMDAGGTAAGASQPQPPTYCTWPPLGSVIIYNTLVSMNHSLNAIQ